MFEEHMLYRKYSNVIKFANEHFQELTRNFKSKVHVTWSKEQVLARVPSVKIFKLASKKRSQNWRMKWIQ